MFLKTVQTFQFGSFRKATSNLTGVINEAKCMNILTLPNIPQLLGVLITSKPCSLIMQFIGEDMKSSTVHQLLQDSNAERSLQYFL